MKQLLLFLIPALLLTVTVSAQKVGINTNTPAEMLDVKGNVKADTVKTAVLKIAANAGASKVLTSDANGNASWAVLPSGNSGGGNSLDSAYNYGGNGAGRIINAVSGPVLIQGTDGLQITGVYNSGADLSLPGTGSKLFYYPKKAAFRAGFVGGSNWNKDSLGDYSFAMGNDTKAKGLSAAAWGYNSAANGSYSTAWGNFSTATAPYATAGGYSCNATGSSSVAFGNFNNARGFYATAIGNNNIANSNGSLVIGTFNDTITAVSSTFDFNINTPLFIIGNGTTNSTRSNAMVVKYNGSVGIGTNNPTSRLEVNANTGAVLINGTDGLQVTGTFNSGADLSLNGAGTRMFFYPKKAAFRAGHVTVANWNKDSIGNYSFAGGYNPIAKGNYAVALGTSASASGEYASALGYAPSASGSSSVAIGFSAKASAANTISIGNYTEAKNAYATAIGYFASATGNNAVAIGNECNAAGENSFAAGFFTHATGTASTSAGANSTASGGYATALGNNAIAAGDNAFSAGGFTTASGMYSTALGYKTIAAASNCIALGRFNDSIAGSSSGTWVANDPLLILGNGADAANRHNSFVLYKNGNGEIDGTFIPTISNTYSLGKNNRKWLDVWATNGVIQTSDARLKKNIQSLNYGLSTVLKMRPVSYQWKEGDSQNQVGFIAQEILELVPEAVVKTSDTEPLGMKYNELIPVLTKAIQEQQAMIEALRVEIRTLKNNK